MINLFIILVVAAFATAVVLYVLSVDRPPSESHKKRFTNKHGLVYKLEDVSFTSFAHLYYWDNHRNYWIPVLKVGYGSRKNSTLMGYEPELSNFTVDYEDMNDNIADKYSSIEQLKEHNNSIRKEVVEKHERWLKIKKADELRVNRYKM